MGGDQRSLVGEAPDERSTVDQQIRTRCLTIGASILVILVALALIALL